MIEDAKLQLPTNCVDICNCLVLNVILDVAQTFDRVWNAALSTNYHLMEFLVNFASVFQTSHLVVMSVLDGHASNTHKIKTDVP